MAGGSSSGKAGTSSLENVVPVDCTPIMSQYDDVSPSSVSENNVGLVRGSGNRNVYTQIRDGLSNERGWAIDASNRGLISIQDPLGQQIMDASLSVALASDQSNIPVTVMNKTATGTIAALNDTVELTLEGCQGASVLVNPTVTGGFTLVIEITLDDVNWHQVSFASISTATPNISSSLIIASNPSYSNVYKLAGALKVRARASSFTSGSYSVTWIGNNVDATIQTIDGVEPGHARDNLGKKVNFSSTANQDVGVALLAAHESSETANASAGTYDNVQTNALGHLKITSGAYITQLDDTGSGGITYIGKATPGTATSSANWQITRLTETGADLEVLYADGDINFDNIWDNRASLSYS